MKRRYKSYIKIISSIALLLLAFVIFFITYSQRQVFFAPRAWNADLSAITACDNSGYVQINTLFTNTGDPADPDLTTRVTVTDNQTGNSTDLGDVPPGQTVTGEITTDAVSIEAGTVLFQLRWSNGSGGQDSRTAVYPALTCVPLQEETEASESADISPTLTPSPTEPDSPSPTEILEEPTPTEILESSTITPSPSETPVPLTESTITPGIGGEDVLATPTSTSTPTPTEALFDNSADPTATPALIADASSTETSTDQQTPAPTIPVAGVPLPVLILFIPIILVAIGFII